MPSQRVQGVEARSLYAPATLNLYPYKVLLCSSALFSSKVLSSGGEGGEGLLYALGVGSSYFNMLLFSALYAPAL